MTSRQLRRYEMLVRVSEFGIAHREKFSTAPLAAPAFAAVSDAVSRLSGHAVDQLELRQEGARVRRAARAELIEMLEAISRTARVVQADNPGVPNLFVMPPRRAAQAVITTAKLFAEHIEPLAQQFIAHSMPETFVADFKRMLVTYDQAVKRQELGKGESAAARAGIEEVLDEAQTAIRRLDVIVANHMREEATILAAWARDRRVPYTRRSEKESPPGAPPQQLDAA